MKKVLFCMFALLTSASMVSCNQKQEAANAAADSKLRCHRREDGEGRCKLE